MRLPGTDAVRSVMAGLRDRSGLVITVCIGLSLCALIIIAGENGLFAYLELRRENARLEQDMSRLTRDIERLEETASRLQSDDAYIEHVARKELGMIAPDELLYQEPSE